MKRWTILACILAVLAVAPVYYLTFYLRQLNPPPSKSSAMVVSFDFRPKTTAWKPGVELEASGCQVIDGYRFIFFCSDGKSFEGHLPVACKAGAEEFVLKQLKSATAPAPVVKLLRETDDHWIVEFHLTVDSERYNLINMLKSQDLLLN